METGTRHELIARSGWFAHLTRGDTGHEPQADGTGHTQRIDTRGEGADAMRAVEGVDVSSEARLHMRVQPFFTPPPLKALASETILNMEV